MMMMLMLTMGRSPTCVSSLYAFVGFKMRYQWMRCLEVGWSNSNKKGKQVITTKSITNDYLMPSHGCSFGYSLDGVVKNNSILSIPDIKTGVGGGVNITETLQKHIKNILHKFRFFFHSDCLQQQPEEELEL